MSPALAGRFSTTAPPGKPNSFVFILWNIVAMNILVPQFWCTFARITLCVCVCVCVYTKPHVDSVTILCLVYCNSNLLSIRWCPNYSIANMSGYYFQPFSCEQALVNFAMLFLISITWDKPAPLPKMRLTSVNTNLLLIFQDSVQVSLPLFSKMRYLSFLTVLVLKPLFEH